MNGAGCPISQVGVRKSGPCRVLFPRGTSNQGLSEVWAMRVQKLPSEVENPFVQHDEPEEWPLPEPCWVSGELQASC